MSGYDGDVATYDPNGKVHQISYAQEAPKLGAPVVGISNENCAIILSVRRSPSKLADYQAKTFRISQNIGCGASGIYADARKMLAHLRSECVEYEYESNESHPLKSLVIKLSNEAQQRTQYGGYRPFGASLLIVGEENDKPALFVTDPNAEYYKFKAHCLGKNSQAANAFLSQYANEITGKTCKELCFMALRALKQAGIMEFESAAVEVGVFQAGQYRNLTSGEIEEMVKEYQQRFPVVNDDEEDS
ncbi:20S_proteasome alpha subunit 6 [Hexamita inflata]|uniref:20S proteasome alpha subunit 6 n=1 Tax=Hexamita inflata TaxID=28002 RepID=A0AA86QEJ7_9EUKA|nr:20S proteasome alpha subunit 6 [Hexamita inflata]CAI9954802.1 20S proteasome alpha subunit 6 [Hexamita inflata]